MAFIHLASSKSLWNGRGNKNTSLVALGFASACEFANDSDGGGLNFIVPIVNHLTVENVKTIIYYSS